MPWPSLVPAVISRGRTPSVRQYAAQDAHLALIELSAQEQAAQPGHDGSAAASLVELDLLQPGCQEGVHVRHLPRVPAQQVARQEAMLPIARVRPAVVEWLATQDI